MCKIQHTKKVLKKHVKNTTIKYGTKINIITSNFLSNCACLPKLYLEITS